MVSFLSVLTTLTALYASTFVYRLIRNLYYCRKSGVPWIVVPLEQNHFVWMVLGPSLRRVFQRNLPDVIYKRLALTIYGFEFHSRLQPFKEWAAPQGNGKTYILASCGRFEFWTWDSELVNQILGRPKDFCQMDLGNILLNKFGENVLTSDGNHWVRQRKVIAGVINERISKAVFEESIRQTQGLLHDVQSLADENGSTETNQLFDWAKRITIHVLSGAGMGASVEWTDEGNEKPKPGFKQTYIQSVKSVVNNIHGPILLPQWLLHNYPSFMPGYSSLKALGIGVEEFPVHTRQMLEHDRQQSRANGGTSKNNILSQLLQASEHPVDADNKSVSGRNTEALTERELLGNLFIFTAAGFDTTANTISYAITLLATYPEWQQWLCVEVDQIVPADPSMELDYATAFNKAIRIQAFMYEVLRLFTPLVHIAKQAKGAQTLRTSTGIVSLPADATVYVNSVCLHLDPDIWRNINLAENDDPSDNDEERFRPSRWINPYGSSQPLFTPPKGTYIPWSMGPRVCPGQKMAQVEIVAIFLTLLRNHEFSPSLLPGETLEQAHGRLERRMRDSVSILTVQMRDIYDVGESSEAGLKLRVTKRS